jgi:O-antigen ligase
MAARLPGLVASAMLAGVAVLYLAIILGEPDPNPAGTVALFAGAMLLAALLAAGGALAHDSYWRRLQFGIAAALTFVLAVLGALSIGILFVPSLLLLMYSIGRG